MNLRFSGGLSASLDFGGQAVRDLHRPLTELDVKGVT